MERSASKMVLLLVALLITTVAVETEGRMMKSKSNVYQPQTFPGFGSTPGLGGGSGLVPGFGLGQPGSGGLGGIPTIPGGGFGGVPTIPGGGLGGFPGAGLPGGGLGGGLVPGGQP